VVRAADGRLRPCSSRNVLHGHALSPIPSSMQDQQSRMLLRTLPVLALQAVGTYEANVRLHPEVLATFSVVIQKDKTVTVSGRVGDEWVPMP
jgi:hypothetical protein